MEWSQESSTDVLVVDDNPGDRRFIEEAFKTAQMDLNIHTVNTRDEALDVVNRQGENEGTSAPDLVFVDWNLSRTTCEEVVTAAKTGDAPASVVVMTGSKATMDELQSSLSQADMIIEKPTHPEGYVETVRSLQTGH